MDWQESLAAERESKLANDRIRHQRERQEAAFRNDLRALAQDIEPDWIAFGLECAVKVREEEIDFDNWHDGNALWTIIETKTESGRTNWRFCLDERGVWFRRDYKQGLQAPRPVRPEVSDRGIEIKPWPYYSFDTIRTIEQYERVKSKIFERVILRIIYGR